MATVIDDADGAPGFVLTGSWTSAAYGHGGNSKYTGSGSGTKLATWTFTGLTPGWYRIGATWVEQANRTKNAPYSVYDNTTLLGSVTLNQELAPDGWTDFGSGTEFTYIVNPNSWGYWRIASTTLKVVLTDNVEDYVFADAIIVDAWNYVRKTFLQGLGF